MLIWQRQIVTNCRAARNGHTNRQTANNDRITRRIVNSKSKLFKLRYDWILNEHYWIRLACIYKLCSFSNISSIWKHVRVCVEKGLQHKSADLLDWAEICQFRLRFAWPIRRLTSQTFIFVYQILFLIHLYDVLFIITLHFSFQLIFSFYGILRCSTASFLRCQFTIRRWSFMICYLLIVETWTQNMVDWQVFSAHQFQSRDFFRGKWWNSHSYILDWQT